MVTTPSLSRLVRFAETHSPHFRVETAMSLSFFFLPARRQVKQKTTKRNLKTLLPNQAHVARKKTGEPSLAGWSSGPPGVNSSTPANINGSPVVNGSIFFVLDLALFIVELRQFLRRRHRHRLVPVCSCTTTNDGASATSRPVVRDCPPILYPGT